MSETSRTDAAALRCACSTYVVPSEFARELERENAALRADKERLDWLTDALDWVELGKCVATDYDEEGRSRLDAWRMAIDAARKEAQP